MNKRQHLRVGSAILAVAALGLGSASAAFQMQGPDVATTLGRLLWAGTLANLSLSLLMFSLAIFPLRRGEKWAFGAFLTPMALYGVPMLYLDSANVAREDLVGTLMPQVLGLATAAAGLLIIAPGVFGKRG